jgi:hypothetical protein
MLPLLVSTTYLMCERNAETMILVGGRIAAEYSQLITSHAGAQGVRHVHAV